MTTKQYKKYLSFWLDYLFHKQRLFYNIIAVLAVRYYLKYSKRSSLSEWQNQKHYWDTDKSCDDNEQIVLFLLPTNYLNGKLPK